MAALSPRLRLLIGITGSVLITLGSLGVGWLGPASMLRSWALFELLRNSRTAVMVCGVLVVLGAVMLLVAWLALGLALLERRRGSDIRVATSQVVASAAAWTAPLLLAVPLFSRDMFAYVAQGRLMAAGLNPYENGVASLPGWFAVGVDPLWADTSTPYGPVFVWLERVVVLSTDALPPEVAIFAFRLLAVVGLALMAYYAWRIARIRGIDEAGVLWAVAASPLVLMNFVVAGHNDSLMLGFIIGGVYYALAKRPLLGTVFVALAIGVKPIAVIALPVIGLIWAGSAAGWGAVIRRWAAVAALGLGTVLVLGWGIGVGAGWIGALSTPVTIASWYAPSSIIGIGIGGLANGLGVDGEAAQLVVKIALLAAGCAVAAWLVIARRRADPLWLLLGCFAAITLSSPVIHPWYGLWLMALLALLGVDRPWRMRVVVYATAFFVLIGLAEPLDLIPRLEGVTPIPFAVIGTAVVGVAIALALTELRARRTFAVHSRVLSAAGATPR